MIKIITALFSLILLFSFFGFLYLDTTYNVSNLVINKDINLLVENGETGVDVVKKIAKTADLKYNFYTKKTLTDYLKKSKTVIQAGQYPIKKNTKLITALKSFTAGDFKEEEIKITFIEGLRVEEYALKLLDFGFSVDFAKEYLELAKQHRGKVFPDTYILKANSNPQDLIKKQLENYTLKTKDIIKNSKSGLTEDQIINFAAILEREMNIEKDRPVVAGVLVKRYKEDWAIDADATTQYAYVQDSLKKDFSECLEDKNNCSEILDDGRLNLWNKDITLDQLQSKNPYNTRGQIGLPPKPIANPSLSSIKAVANYTNTDYYFYITDNSGITHFADTLEQHNVNVEKYLR